MLRGFVLGCIAGALIVGSILSLSGGWYEYEMLDPTRCAMFKNGSFNVSPGHIAPNQPNECYIRTPRIYLP